MAAASGLTAEEAAFLFYPNRYAHVSWRAELMPAAVWDLLAGSPRVEGRFAAFVIEKTGLGDPPVAALATPQARFCQLPGPAAVKVAQKVGLALNGARIARLIDAKLVGRIRSELGAEAHEFAIRRAPLLTHQLDPLAPDLAAEMPLGELFERSGVNYIGLALSPLESAVRARFRLKLPRPYASLLDSPQGDVASEAAWQVVRKVVREAEPEWSASLD
jgi:hypothetical protein